VIGRRSWILIVLAVPLALAGLTAGYVKLELAEPESFADRSLDALKSKEVQAAIAKQVAVEILERGSPDLVASRPLVLTAIEAVLETDVFARVLRRAAVTAHDVLLRGERDVIVELEEVTEVLVSVALLVYARGLPLEGSERPPSLGRLAVRFPVLCLAVLHEITVGTWQMALVVTGLRPLREPGIVAIPVGDRSTAGVAASALLATLSPGEVFVDVDHERQVMLLQVIDASDPDAVRERHDAFYRRYQRGVFP
jgi:multisubunit Na+/H+ antiporter MnhE subunit